MRIGIFLTLLCATTWAQAQPKLPQSELDSFEKVWTTIRDSHWEAKPGGLDWNAIHAEFRPRIERASTPEEARAITQEMLARLQETHFGIMPSSVYNAAYSDAPSETGSGVTGIDLRVLDGEAVVTTVDPGSPADRAGVRPGWIIVRAEGSPFRPVIAAIQSSKPTPSKATSGLQELQLTRSLLARLSGPVGATRSIVFTDGSGQSVPLMLELTKPRGQLATLGNLPASAVWFDDRAVKISGSNFAEYVHFNEFLDIPRVMPAFEKSVRSCISAATCHGLIIDLRGNPGGVGAMAMGMAGFLLDQPNQKLGTMYMREATLNFVINPRAAVYSGPIAILIDANSASTSEILAGGLQDLHRARVFGTHSAAAALPSIFERLPNGDGFQYAVANYISQGGKPLEGLGVTPDEEVRLTRKGLLAGHDAVIDAAVHWIDGQTKAGVAQGAAK